MLSQAIMMTVLTHPLQVLLIGVIISRLAREGVAVATQARQARRMGSGSHPAPAADASDLRAA